MMQFGLGRRPTKRKQEICKTKFKGTHENLQNNRSTLQTVENTNNLHSHGH